MNHFTISEIETLTGIKAHTLRIWEQRYQVCLGKRKGGGHRFYDDEDLKQMLRLAYLYKKGFKISKLAALKEGELCELAYGCCTYLQDEFVDQLVVASQAFDQLLFDKIIDMLILHLGLEKCMLQVVYPFLEKMGLLWLTDKVIPAQEHFSSNLIRKKLLVAIDGLRAAEKEADSVFLLFTPEGESHEIPLLFIQYIFKKNGKRTVYLGKEVSFETIRTYCENRRVTHLYLHIVTSLCKNELHNYLLRLTEIKKDLKIIISGPALSEGCHLPAGIKKLHSISEVMHFARQKSLTSVRHRQT